MNRTVLITGANMGMGLALVKQFLQGGYEVFAGVYQSAMDLDALAEEYGSSLALIPLMESGRSDLHRLSWQSSALVRRTEWTFPTNAS